VFAADAQFERQAVKLLSSPLASEDRQRSLMQIPANLNAEHRPTDRRRRP
jgi:hypothetical protein